MIFDLINKKYKNNDYKPWIRSCNDKLLNILSRKFILKSLSLKYFSKNIKKLSIDNKIKVNNGFSGIYNFIIKNNFEHIFMNFLKSTSNGHLIMVHPGISDRELASLDSVTLSRDLEYEFLKSESFDNLLKNFNIKIIKQSKYIELTSY